MVTTTTIDQTADRARPVPSRALPTTGEWRGGSDADAASGTTGIAMFAFSAYGNETNPGNCPADAVEHTITRSSRHLVTGST